MLIQHIIDIDSWMIILVGWFKFIFLASMYMLFAFFYLFSFTFIQQQNPPKKLDVFQIQ